MFASSFPDFHLYSHTYEKLRLFRHAYGYFAFGGTDYYLADAAGLGRAGGQCQNQKPDYSFAAAALAVTGLFFVRANSFLTFLLALFFLYLFLPPIFSIGEAMSLEASDNAPRPFYSFVRAFGSGAYALTGVTVALLGLSDIDMIFKLMIGVLALCMVQHPADAENAFPPAKIQRRKLWSFRSVFR